MARKALRAAQGCEQASRLRGLMIRRIQWCQKYPWWVSLLRGDSGKLCWSTAAHCLVLEQGHASSGKELHRKNSSWSAIGPSEKLSA